MNREPVPSTAERVKASVKEAIGKLAGDTRAQTEGHAEKTRGRAQRDAPGAQGKMPDGTKDET